MTEEPTPSNDNNDDSAWEALLASPDSQAFLDILEQEALQEYRESDNP